MLQGGLVMAQTTPALESIHAAPGVLQYTRIRKSPYYHASRHPKPLLYSVYNHVYHPRVYFDPIEEYWQLLNGVTLWDVAVERQVEITGPDAFTFTNMLVPRDLNKCKVGQCKYVFITSEEGGILNDPVLLRLEENHFWLSLADSDVLLWAKGVAVNSGLNVTIREPDVAPMQIQGPKSKEVMVDLFGESILDIPTTTWRARSSTACRWWSRARATPRSWATRSTPPMLPATAPRSGIRSWRPASRTA